MKCAAFWKHANIRPGNRVYPCCRFKTPVCNFDGDVKNIIHSTAYQELRTESSQGKFISGCEKCYYEESIGHKSLRQEFNEQYDTDTAELEYLEIGIDNLCNLTCDGCNSEFSTSWMAKEKLIYGEPLHGLMENLPITSVPSSVKKILFLGGEPLITDKHLDLIKNIDTSIEIVYNTNATFIPNNTCLEQMKRHKTRFIISIDGYGALNETVREGTKWQQVENFIQWAQLHKFDFEFNTVLHINNYYGIFELQNYLADFDKNWYINVLTYPTNLDIKNLSTDKKQHFVEAVSKSTLPNKEFILNHLI